jgi:hypothetical protein
MGKDIFISYAQEDLTLADDLHRALVAEGLSCWQAPDDIPPGTSYPEAIIEAINTCRLLLLLFSASANSSPHVEREVERAVSKQCPILAVRLGSFVLSPAMEYLLSPSQWLDASSLTHAQCLARTTALIKALLSGGSRVQAAGARLSQLAIHIELHSVFDMPVDALAISIGGFENYARSHRLSWSQGRLRMGDRTIQRVQLKDPHRSSSKIFIFPERVQREPSEDGFRDAVNDFLHAAQREGATSFAIAPTGKTAGFSRQRALRASLNAFSDYLSDPQGGLTPTIGTLRFAVKETQDMRYEHNQLLNELRNYFSQGTFAESYRVQDGLAGKDRLPVEIQLIRQGEEQDTDREFPGFHG